MKNMHNFVIGAACLCLCIACSSNPVNGWDDGDDGGTQTGGDGGSSGSSDTSGNLLDFDVSWDDISDASYIETAETVVTDKSDDEYDDFVENSTFSSVINIVYSGTSATVTGTVDGVTVTMDGAHVTVNSSVSGVEYALSGSSTDGSFKVYSDKKFKLTLAGVSLINTKGAAINIQSSKRVFVESKASTDNVLTDASEYTTVEGEDQKGCFFSEGQLIFGGTGTLTITGKYKHGICSDDYVRLRSGSSLTIASAAKDGIHTNDKVIIGGGTLNITSSGDGIECEEGFIDIRGGIITVSAEDDAVTASYEDTDTSITPYIKVSDGLLKLSTTGDKGMALKATGDVTVSGGYIKADVQGAASKGIKSDGNVTLSGGQMVLLTSGTALYEDNDLSSSAGINCDGNLVLNGASVEVKSTGAAGKGLSCDGLFTADNSTIKIITTGKQYTYGNLDSSAKGIKAEGNLTINSGTVQVKVTGGEGSEGIESKSTLTLGGGNIAVYAYDDCINASNSIVINGGNIYC
ncbi:MAG: carbohydrate-binding domain-containing protein [Bacteroides sp.]|nr:carbohydrate-binding domain-containing protein [Bacteroides sp.]